MKVILTNVQSHSKTCFELKKNVMNIIVAPNETGKSVMYKTFKLLFLGSKVLGRDYRVALIRDGASFGEIKVIEDDTVLGVRFYKTYEVYFFNDKEFMQNEPPQEIIDFFKIVKWEDLLLNILDNHSSKFLLDDDVKKNGKFLTLALSSNLLGLLKVRLEDKFVDIKEIEHDIKQKEKFLKKRLETMRYRDTTTLTLLSEELKSIKKDYELKNYILKELYTFKDNYKYTENFDYKDIESKIKLLKTLYDFRSNYKVVPDIDFTDYENKISLLQSILTFKENYRFISNIEDKKDLIKEYFALKNFKKNYKYNIDKALANVQAELDKINVCPVCKQPLKKGMLGR